MRPRPWSAHWVRAPVSMRARASASSPPAKSRSFTGSHSHGQGHETTFAQVVADGLGVGIEDVDIIHGDTESVPFGMGTYGSRSLAVGGTAIVKSMDKIKEKGAKIAAHLLEAAEEDLEFAEGSWTVKGTDQSIAFGEVALAAYVPHNFPEGWSRGWSLPASTTRPILPSPLVLTSRSWRWMPRPAWLRCGATSLLTTWAISSIP